MQARGKKKRAGKDMDMEVTFTPGLEGLGARLLAQRKEASQRKGDTVWEAYLRRQKYALALAAGHASYAEPVQCRLIAVCKAAKPKSNGSSRVFLQCVYIHATSCHNHVMPNAS